MTPKEKAKELINFMYDVDIKEDSEFKPTMKWSYARRCAIIAADEVIKTLSPYLGDDNARDYWNEVKQEIQSL